jgi:hypothetical protein
VSISNEITQQEHIFNVFSQFPEGLAAYELRELLDDDAVYQNVSALLSLYVSEGIAEKRGSKVNPATRHLCTVYAANGTPYSSRKLSKRAPERGMPAPRKLTNRLHILQARIDTLESWKADAISRYPDLGTPPIIDEARKRIAEIFTAEGDHIKAQLVLSGEMDRTDVMRAVVAIIDGDTE